MEQTVNSIENFNYVVNIFVLLENKCNDRKCWRWLGGHADSGWETMIQFVVALYCNVQLYSMYACTNY